MSLLNLSATNLIDCMAGGINEPAGYSLIPGVRPNIHSEVAFTKLIRTLRPPQLRYYDLAATRT